MAIKDLFNNFFVVEEEEEVEGPEERESSRSRERVQEREDYNRNENQATPQTFNNKQQAIKSVPQKNTLRSNTTSEERNYRMSNNSKSNTRNVVTMNNNVQSNYATQESSKMCLFEPRVFSDTQDIADELKNRRATLVNLQRIDKVSAKRIIDFLSGTVYAIGGDIQRVGTDIFLCTPDNVEVAGSITDHIENMEHSFD